MLLRVFRSPGEDEDRTRSPAVVLALVEREGPAAARSTPGVLLMRLGPRVEDRPDIQVRMPIGQRSLRTDPPAFPPLPALREQGSQLRGLQGGLPDDRTRR